MDTVGTVGQVGWQEGCFQGSLHNRSGYNHALLYPKLLPTLFSFNWRGNDYVWATLSSGWNESPFLYSTLLVK